MTTRLATPLDAPDIARIHVAAWRAAYAQEMPADFLRDLSVEGRTAMWRQALSEPGPGITALALDETGTPVGFCVYGPSRDADAQGAPVGELVAINIHPSSWGRGHGHALCQRVWAHGSAQGWREVSLWVLKGNARARRFYENLGWRPDGTEKRSSQLVGAELHELRYRKGLG